MAPLFLLFDIDENELRASFKAITFDELGIFLVMEARQTAEAVRLPIGEQLSIMRLAERTNRMRNIIYSVIQI